MGTEIQRSSQDPAPSHPSSRQENLSGWAATLLTVTGGSVQMTLVGESRGVPLLTQLPTVLATGELRLLKLRSLGWIRGGSNGIGVAGRLAQDGGTHCWQALQLSCRFPSPPPPRQAFSLGQQRAELYPRPTI